MMDDRPVNLRIRARGVLGGKRVELTGAYDFDQGGLVLSSITASGKPANPEDYYEEFSRTLDSANEWAAWLDYANYADQPMPGAKLEAEQRMRGGFMSGREFSGPEAQTMRLRIDPHMLDMPSNPTVYLVISADGQRYAAVRPIDSTAQGPLEDKTCLCYEYYKSASGSLFSWTHQASFVDPFPHAKWIARRWCGVGK